MRSSKQTGAARNLLMAFLFFAATTGTKATEPPAPPIVDGAGPDAIDPAVSRSECVEHRGWHLSGTPDEQLRLIETELLNYQSLAEEVLAMRAKAIRLRGELSDKLDRGEPLSGRDLQRLNQGAAEMLDQREALFKMSLAHECWLDDPVSADPQSARIQRIGIGMSLSAALILYDNYLAAISYYRSDPTLRRHLNRSDSGFHIPDGKLNNIAASFASPDNRARVRKGLVWFERHGQANGEWVATEKDGYQYLLQLIEQSPSRNMVRHARPVEFLGNMLGMFSTMTLDTLLGLKNEGTHLTSLLFGNAVGLVESRRGKLDGKAAVRERLSSTVQAGDILLEKTPFRLTDTFIPGHWGHVALWVGTEAELRELGIWDHPVVQPFQDQIRRGVGVVEALRSGVVMNPLGHFLNIDDLAVLRDDNLEAGQRAEIVLQALRQVGKDYDFNFDVQTTDKIVCSELIYHTYLHLDWPIDRVLGRVTISPDNVAVRATRVGPLGIHLLYLNGEEVVAEQTRVMERLVKKQVVHMARQ
jgi:uncharacterized protein YycO